MCVSDDPSQEGSDPDLVYVWCDYFSIPQANRHNQKAAIDSIPQYASNATSFLACAPDTCAARAHTPVTKAISSCVASPLRASARVHTSATRMLQHWPRLITPPFLLFTSWNRAATTSI